MKIIKMESGEKIKVDDADYESLTKQKWYNFRGYALRWQGRRIFYMHRVIMDVAWDNDLVVDHINGDKLDNRRSNLRMATRSQNAQNRPASYHPNKTSKYKGVGWITHMGKWRTRIQIEGKRQTIGFYENEDDAALAYNETARKLYGKNAYLNVIKK